MLAILHLQFTSLPAERADDTVPLSTRRTGGKLLDSHDLQSIEPGQWPAHGHLLPAELVGLDDMKTYMAKPGEVEQKWHVIDATDQIVGRLASRIAVLLMGKHRPTYTPHVDTGDFVVVINAEKVKMTGNKWQQKEYRWYTGYPGQRSVTAETRLERKPELILHEAVRRMLPKNKLAYKMITKLKIYAGPDHPHQAQQPEPLEVAAK